jgi:hypothetical protein
VMEDERVGARSAVRIRCSQPPGSMDLHDMKRS